MEISPYILTSEYNGKQLLYSTLTTAFVELPTDIYKKIFKDRDFSDTANVERLVKMGFLTDDYRKQLDLLNKIYRAEMGSKTPVVKIFSTNKCNARCYYCFEEGINQVEMSEETAIKTAEFIIGFYPEKDIQINWFGGEPLLNFKVIKIITDKLIGNGFTLTTHITTNGSLLTEEMVDFFVKNYRTVSCQITIDELFEKYYHIKRYTDLTAENAFEIVTNNIELLLKKGVSTRVRINFLKTKFERATEIFSYLKKRFADYSSLVIYLAPLTFDDEEKVFSQKQLADTENIHYRLMKFYSDNDVTIDIKDEQKNLLSSLSLKPKAIPCGACRTKNLTISAEGTICKCHRVAKYPERMFGNVNDGIDPENPNYQVFLKSEPLDDECAVCRVLPICRGGCRVLSVINGNKKKTCSIYKYHPELIKLLYERIKSQQND